MNFDINYYEKDGRIGVKYLSNFYLNDIEDYRPFNAELMDEFNVGLIPSDVQKMGKTAITEYAVQACQKDWQKRRRAVLKKIRSREKRIDTMNIPLTVTHSSGITLIGLIVKNPDGYGIRVTLEAPFKSEEAYIFNYPNCFAACVGGLHVYKIDGTLSDVVLKDSRKAVAKLYDEELTRQKHGDVLDIVESLNSAIDVDD
ncbi:MAG: hypothetical protein P1P90_02050 [Patescibacteria group bacterium]|nr:hypothetical protein [Patescibacteria group bacterium]